MKSESDKEKQIRPTFSADRSVERTQQKVGHARRSTVPVDRSPCYSRLGGRPSYACVHCARRSIGRSADHYPGCFLIYILASLDSDLCTISVNELKKLFYQAFISSLPTILYLGEDFSNLSRSQHSICRFKMVVPVWLPMFLTQEIKLSVVHPNERHRAHATGRISSNSSQCVNFTPKTTLVSILSGFSSLRTCCNSISPSSRISQTKWNRRQCASRSNSFCATSASKIRIDERFITGENTSL